MVTGNTAVDCKFFSFFFIEILIKKKYYSGVIHLH